MSTENLNTAVRESKWSANVYVLPVQCGEGQSPGQLRLHSAVYYKVRSKIKTTWSISTDSRPSQDTVTTSVQVCLYLQRKCCHENSWSDVWVLKSLCDCVHGIITSAICSFLCSRYWTNTRTERRNWIWPIVQPNEEETRNPNAHLLLMSSNVHKKTRGSAEVHV